jgi:hypothetical protein
MNVVDIAQYIRHREASAQTMPSSVETSLPGGRVSSQSSSFASSEEGVLSARIYQTLDADPQLNRFFELNTQGMRLLEETLQLLKDGQLLLADDRFMACKRVFTELLVLRDISDSVGLIAMRCFQSAVKVQAITDVPNLPGALLRALHRMHIAPYMKFADACVVSDMIEAASSPLPLTGYVETSAELIADAQALESA